MAATKRFAELPVGQTFTYNSSKFRKVTPDRAADPNDDAITYPFSPDFIVEPTDEPVPVDTRAQDDPPRDGVSGGGFRATGNVTENAATPADDGLDGLTVEELKTLATENEVEHKASARKPELVAALRAAGVQAPTSDEDE
jgi:hypothetical protein